jgi:hypothetical protein
MHISWRLSLWVSFVVIATVLIWIRIASQHHAKPATIKPITDLAATSPLNQPSGEVAPAEAYEIYSALYSTPMQEPVAFAENSVTDIPQVNGSCLQPSTQEEHEMTDAFVAANRQSHRWEQKFSIPQGYRLLQRSELTQVHACLATQERDVAGCASYKQLKHVRYLGVPGFDHMRTHALVSVIKSCGGLCGSGGIFVVEKTNGRWQRVVPTDFTRNCSWMY